ncbi:MAG: S16 family serine protease, partial [Candidatus Izemoplasmatales bacterium]|nr:S16 family serine protease [Candidatus Izemoplasmatales bacterium]
LSSYTEIEKFYIAKQFLIDKQVNNHGLDSKKLQITDATIKTIIRDYTREAGVRQLERLIGSIVRKSIKQILTKNLDSITIKQDNLNKYLGKPLFKNNQVLKSDMIGVVTGLAYTMAGGDTLEVEATYYQGKNSLVLTGNLGDVMKESAMTALSYVKSNAEKLKIDHDLLEKNDFHIHVPEGAIPKDGPSAGVTIATALISVLTNRKVNRFIGMTGEITLNGRVLPIGGLKEKAIAASRTGLKEIIIPEGNEKDIEDIPKEVQDVLKIHLAKSIDDVIKIALLD